MFADKTYDVETENGWYQFVEYAKDHCSATAFRNWIAPISLIEMGDELVILEIPNIFVKEYLFSNFGKELSSFLPVGAEGLPSIEFVVAKPVIRKEEKIAETIEVTPKIELNKPIQLKLNSNYTFESFIEGPANQFVKSVAMGVAKTPGKSYNPLFIHGGVGLGKTHILHSIGHYLQKHSPKSKIQCITTEAFINELVDALRNKSIDQLKRYYRSEVDVLLVDDIQFLQNRLNFEEELCGTFEALINQGKQIVITSDKPPSQLKLSERMTARMEWGLVAHLGVPELETRVAILQHKAQQKGLDIPSSVAFYIAEHIYHNVRQLEGAINRLSAQCCLLDLKITEDMVQRTLREMLQHAPKEKISVDQILKSVAAVFQVRVSDLKGNGRTKEVALPRQVAMYLACKMIKGTLQMLSDSFGKTHSTILHACKAIEKKVATSELLRRQITMVERDIQS